MTIPALIPAMQSVASTNIDSVGHDGQHVYIQFKSGGIWKYPATADEHAALLSADSVGKHFHANLKGRGGEKVV